MPSGAVLTFCSQHPLHVPQPPQKERKRKRFGTRVRPGLCTGVVTAADITFHENVCIGSGTAAALSTQQGRSPAPLLIQFQCLFAQKTTQETKGMSRFKSRSCLAQSPAPRGRDFHSHSERECAWLMGIQSDLPFHSALKNFAIRWIFIHQNG